MYPEAGSVFACASWTVMSALTSSPQSPRPHAGAWPPRARLAKQVVRPACPADLLQRIQTPILPAAGAPHRFATRALAYVLPSEGAGNRGISSVGG